MQKLELNDGLEMPSLGFGTYQLHGKEGLNATKTAISLGYRLIDTAAYYKNEDLIGQALRESDIGRSELFITTKLWRDDLGYESTLKAFEKSLKKLKLDYLELYLIHWPANLKNFDNWAKTNADTWRAMEKLRAEGRVKSIGVSNFCIEHLEALSHTANITPSVNQIEFHPGYWQPEVVDYCQRNNIQIEAWSPLARGRAFESKELQRIADTHNKTIGQVCLRWVVQHNAIAIPKSSTPQRIEENIDIFDFELTDDEIHVIDNLPRMGFSGELPNEWE